MKQDKIIKVIGLFHGNAMDLICDLDDHSIDLTILDPDYQDWADY